MAQRDADDVIAELRCELARTRVKLRASQAREQVQREALAPFAIAWPLQRAKVVISQPEGLLSSQSLELLAMQPFHTINVRGTPQRVHITLTGEHLKDAFEAIYSTTQEGRR